MGAILGYARVSTADQELEAQRRRLTDAGAIHIFEDVISGRNFERAVLAWSGDIYACCQVAPLFRFS